MAEKLEQAQRLLAARDVKGLLRHLRADGDALPLDEMSRLVAEAAQLAEFDDLARAAAAVAGGGAADPQALYDFGYACLDQGAAYLAVRPLARALELAPGSARVLSELAAALEQDGQHARAVAVLEEYEPALHWTHRFQLVYNAVLAGDLDKAADGFARLPEPEDASWQPAREKVRLMLARAGVIRPVASLDRQDLRGWHYALTGGILASLSPWGFDQGMNGRWAYLIDSMPGCAHALARLHLVLAEAGACPRSVALLPDRDSQILGIAAAALLGLPATDFDPGAPAPDCLVVAYDLTATEPAALAALRRRAPGQVLFERATCWTAPPRVSADVSGLLGQLVDPPWAPRVCLQDDGVVGPGPADERPAGVIAADLASTAPERDPGDGDGPPDTDEGLRRFTATVTAPGDGAWLGGLREWVADVGPVTGHRFA